MLRASATPHEPALSSLSGVFCLACEASVIVVQINSENFDILALTLSHINLQLILRAALLFLPFLHAVAPLLPATGGRHRSQGISPVAGPSSGSFNCEPIMGVLPMSSDDELPV